MSVFYLMYRIFILISGNYVLKPANQVCTSNEIIDNVDECKLAISQLNVQFIGSQSSGSHPKGCWTFIPSVGSTNAFWNTHSSGSAYVNANAICKTGEWFDVITINLLYA